MKSNYEILEARRLSFDGYELDLHNDFDFKGFDYSVADRRLVLTWVVAKNAKGAEENSRSVSLKFFEVSEFRYMPRNANYPFTEDTCISHFGYWVDEDWSDGVIIPGAGLSIEPHWLTAIDFMSGAVLAVKAEDAVAEFVI